MAYRCFAVAAVAFLGLMADGSMVRAQNDWGTVTGQIVWGGASVPAAPALNVNKDQAHCLEKGPILSEELVIDKDTKGIANIFIWLAPIPPAKTLAIHPSMKAVPKEAVEMDQPACAFIPHAVAIRQGQTLIVKNSAPVAHNVNWSGSQLLNPGGNVILPPGSKKEISDLKADKRPINVACNIHGWMTAKIGVFDHPYFFVTGKDGKFEIKQAPAGSCRLFIWSEKEGWLHQGKTSTGQNITIPANGKFEVGKIELK
jgi:plastocyanin